MEALRIKVLASPLVWLQAALQERASAALDWASVVSGEFRAARPNRVRNGDWMTRACSSRELVLNCVFVCVCVGGLFNQQGSQSSHLINTASALSAPSVLSDERDSVLAKWNQLQAFWGTGRGYFNSSTPPVEFSQENPFCRFKVLLMMSHHSMIGVWVQTEVWSHVLH